MVTGILDARMALLPLSLSFLHTTHTQAFLATLIELALDLTHHRSATQQ